MPPPPVALKPEAPPVWVAVYVTPVKILGKLSLMTAPETLLGPPLVTTIVYVFFAPATVAVLPSFTVTLRSALKVMVSESVAVLLAVFGSGTSDEAVTVALLDRVPVAAELTFPVAL